jgi:hypothetical protein
VSSILSLNLNIGNGQGSGNGNSGNIWEARSGATPSPTFSHPIDCSESINSQNIPVDSSSHHTVLREADRTWHNPSVDQMVETLQVAMMTKRDALVPIPIHYNSHVLALIESLRSMRRQLIEAEDQLTGLRCLREKELEQFRAMSEEWMTREDQYRAEIRRLELLMARNKELGMESVALARSGSLVDRGLRKPFQDRLKRLSGSTDDEGRLIICCNSMIIYDS